MTLSTLSIIQRNSSNPDTNGAEESVHISEVSLLQGYARTVLLGERKGKDTSKNEDNIAAMCKVTTEISSSPSQFPDTDWQTYASGLWYRLNIVGEGERSNLGFGLDVRAA